MRTNLTESFEEALQNSKITADNIPDIESRSCASDEYDGIEYEFRGECIPVRPLLDVVKQEELLRVESILFVDEWDDPKLVMFVAEIEETNGKLLI